MKRLYCHACQRYTGFARKIGVGTLLLSVITFGFWLFLIPLYPAVCQLCGIPRRENLSAAARAEHEKFWPRFLLFCVVVLVVSFFLRVFTNVYH